MMDSPMYAFLLKFALLTAADPMAKAKKQKRIKTAAPQRVINPAQAHTVRLYPRQGLRVVLDSPKASKFTGPKAKWKFTLYSPYLSLTGMSENRRGQEVYEFSQVYDLATWAGTSEVYLGEIHYELEDNDHPEAAKAPQGGSMMIYSIPEQQARPDVLTVINPDQYIVKVEPHRTLEIVLFEDWPKGHLDQWDVQVEDVEAENQGIFLTENTRTWITDSNDGGVHAGQNVLPRHTPPINPNLPEAVRHDMVTDQHSRTAPTREHHFWFSFTKDSQKVAANLKSGDHVVSKLTFSGRCQGIPGKVVKKQMIVMLSLHGKRSKITETEEPEVQLTDEERMAKALVRVKDRNVLTNPAPTEQLDFNSAVSQYVIEIVTPKWIWPDEPEDARWEINHDSTHLKDTYLTIGSLAPIQKYGVTFQRFSIVRKTGSDVPALLEQKLMGAFKISYPKKQHTEDGVRRVSVWIVKESETAKASGYSNNSPRTTRNIYSAPANTQSFSSGGNHWKQGQGFYSGRPEKMQVHFEELESTLDAGVKTRRLCDVNPYYRTPISYYDAEDYYYGTRTVPVKKKETDSLPTPPRNSAGAYTVRETTGSTSQGGSTPTTTTAASEEEYILYNPVNLQEITLVPKQDVVIRLAQPEDVFLDPHMKEKVKGDLWGCVALQVGEIKPVIYNHRVHTLTSLKYRQEIRIRIDPNVLPEAPGTYNAGAVQLQSGGGNRIVRFYIKKGQSEERLHTPLAPTKLLTNLVTHEAAGRKYEYAPTWKHDDCVVLDPTTMFYVKNPPCTPEWPGEWSLRLIQTAIPLELWDKLKNTRDVNRTNPWFKRDQPVHLNGCMFFKPITMSFNDNLDEFLKELAALTKAVTFPVATILYENTRKANESTDNGSQEVLTRIRRRLYLYVALPKAAPTETDELLELPPIKVDERIYDVDHSTQIHTKVNEQFVVRIKPTTVERGDGHTKFRWTMGAHPGWIDYHGHTQSDYDVFRMRARKPGTDTVTLRSGGKTMVFKVAAT